MVKSLLILEEIAYAITAVAQRLEDKNNIIGKTENSRKCNYIHKLCCGQLDLNATNQVLSEVV